MEGDAMPCFMLRGAKQLAKASANPCAEARLPSYPMPFPPLCLLPSEPGGGGGRTLHAQQCGGTATPHPTRQQPRPLIPMGVQGSPRIACSPKPCRDPTQAR